MTHEQDERGDPLNRTHDSARQNFDAIETRPGGLGRPVFRVLGASLILAVLAWAALELWAEKTEPDQPSNNASQSSTTSDSMPSGQGSSSGAASEAGKAAPVDRDPTAGSSTGGDNQLVTPDGSAN